MSWRARHVVGRLLRRDSCKVIVERLEVADWFLSRLVGLQFRRHFFAGSGLLLVPCSGIHTCFLRFPLDVILLAADGRVLAAHRHVRPWRLVPPLRGAAAVLELPGGCSSLEPGDSVRFEPLPGARVPPKLALLAG